MSVRRKAIACSVQLLLRPRAARRHPDASSIAAWSTAVSPNATDAASRKLMDRYYAPLRLTVLWPQMAAMRQMSCCAGLGSPPPREIVVEYSNSGEGDDFTDEFIKLANEIEEKFPEFVVSGNPDELRPREGAFEITSGDAVLFSKFETERLPEFSEVIRAIDGLPQVQCTAS